MSVSYQRKHSRKPVRILDLILILLILCVLGGIVVFFFRNPPASLRKSHVHIEYVLESTDIRDEFADSIRVGDTVYETNTLRKIGEVIAVEYAQSTKQSYSQNADKILEVPYPNRTDIRITIRANADHIDDAYTIKDVGAIRMNTRIAYLTPSFSGEGICLSLRELDG